jgi:hypothetical protein
MPDPSVGSQPIEAVDLIGVSADPSDLRQYNGARLVYRRGQGLRIVRPGDSAGVALGADERTNVLSVLDVANAVMILAGAGAPVNGVSGTGAGVSGPGSLYIDRTAAVGLLYINTNTLASPTWTKVGTQV